MVSTMSALRCLRLLCRAWKDLRNTVTYQLSEESAQPSETKQAHPY